MPMPDLLAVIGCESVHLHPDIQLIISGHCIQTLAWQSEECCIATVHVRCILLHLRHAEKSARKGDETGHRKQRIRPSFSANCAACGDSGDDPRIPISRAYCTHAWDCAAVVKANQRHGPGDGASGTMYPSGSRTLTNAAWLAPDGLRSGDIK